MTDEAGSPADGGALGEAGGYAFYRDGYGGSLCEEAFIEASVPAARLVRWLCADALPRGEAEELAFRRAVCAAADAYAEWGEGQVGGVAIGSFKLTHYDNRGTTGDELAASAALRELSGTGLAFCGAAR